MTATLVIPEQLALELMAAARQPLETAAVLLVSVLKTDCQNFRVLVRQIIWISDSEYTRRDADALSITSDGYVPALAIAESLNAAAVWFHTHPGLGSTPLPSSHDDIVDQQIADLFRLRTGSPYYGALIVSPSDQSLTFTGFLQVENDAPIAIERLWIVGSKFRLITAYNARVNDVQPAFDRNVRAFGGAIQLALGDLRVGVVGCGGTGSSVAEQLVRLVVRHLTLIDPDTLSNSNITRVYGSTPSDVGAPKVLVLCEHLKRIAPDVQCITAQSMVTVEATARQVGVCDAIFGCTDDNAGRLVLSRIASYLMTPVIDCGVLLSSDAEGILIGIDGRVTILAPGEACLVCRGRIDLARASAELMTPEERVRLENEGYAPALGAVEPAVVTFTTLVGSVAVSELLERFIGYGPTPRPSEVLIRCHDREISTNIAKPHQGHYCDPDAGKLGIGFTDPFLELMWIK